MNSIIIKTVLISALIVMSYSGWSQGILVSWERKENGGYILFAENKNVYPLTIKLTPEIVNLLPEFDNEHLYIIPANEKKFYLATFSVDKAGQKYFFKYNYKYHIGDATKATDISFVYQLPFAKGVSYKLFQGYNGNFSHRGNNELDFTMPVGTKIYAARGGLIINVLDTNDKTCPDIGCAQFNNYIKVLHDDGTIGNYLHIKQNSSQVKIGQTIKQNDLIAESGNVGWSSGPHLHFSITKPTFGKDETLATKFLVQGSQQPEILKEGESYSW